MITPADIFVRVLGIRLDSQLFRLIAAGCFSAACQLPEQQPTGKQYNRCRTQHRKLPRRLHRFGQIIAVFGQSLRGEQRILLICLKELRRQIHSAEGQVQHRHW